MEKMNKNLEKNFFVNACFRNWSNFESLERLKSTLIRDAFTDILEYVSSDEIPDTFADDICSQGAVEIGGFVYDFKCWFWVYRSPIIIRTISDYNKILKSNE